LIPDPSYGNTGYYTTDFNAFTSITLPVASYTTAKYIKNNPLFDSRVILLTTQSTYFVSRNLTVWTQRLGPEGNWTSLI
jgi:tRNA(His) 5'-end guanylyltransferase